MPEAKVVKAWVAWGNKDQTEGRGPIYPYAVCECEATAHRKAKGIDTQGGTGKVTQVELHEVQFSPHVWDVAWYGPVYVEPPTTGDLQEETRLRQRREALEAAKAAGLTDEQINALRA